jgi:hypothetical protein
VSAATIAALTGAALFLGALLYVVRVALTQQRLLEQKRSELSDEMRLREEAEARLAKTEKQAKTLVERVAPLIEKTDWMTGRWHGQFTTLVDLENKRNERVEQARKALWDIPLVFDLIRLSVAPTIEVEDHTK